MSTVRAPSSPSFQGLAAFAAASAPEARAYLEQVKGRLEADGAKAPAAIVAALLNTDGPLDKALEGHRERLLGLFPEQGTSLGSIQAKRESTLGWQATDERRPAQQIDGTLSTRRMGQGSSERLTITTPGGKRLDLAEAIANSASFPMARSWLHGFMGDGPVSLKGSLGKDGETFNVEAFAFNKSGRFGNFTFARVVVDGDSVTLSSPRGAIDVTAPKLKAILKQLPALGIVLPGEPSQIDGKLVFATEPDVVQVLARFKDTGTSDGTTVKAPVDLARSAVVAITTTLPNEYLNRTEHRGRLWLEGQFVTNEKGELTGFDASYVSKRCDGMVDIGANVPDADPIQAAVTLAHA